MMLEVTGERLARRCLESSSADEQCHWGVTLADFLPERPIGWPCWPDIESISDSIPLSTLTAANATPEAFTALLYRRIEKQALDDQRCGQVLGFFRGFCRAFFQRPPASDSQPSGSGDQAPGEPACDTPARSLAPEPPGPPTDALEEPTPGLLNFNDLLGVLLECNSLGTPDRCSSQAADLWEPDKLIAVLVQLLEAMQVEERLQPELLLGRFCSDRCVLRRKRLSYAVGLDLETTEALVVILSGLRRMYRGAPLPNATPGAA
jgi:hypothetical protein